MNTEVERWKMLGLDVWDSLCGAYDYKWPTTFCVPMVGRPMLRDEADDSGIEVGNIWDCGALAAHSCRL